MIFVEKKNKNSNVALVNLYTTEEFKKIVKESFSFKELVDKLGYISRSGVTYKIVKERIKKENIDISHFGTTKKYHILTKENVFKKDSDVSPSALRKWFLKENIPYICS